MARRPTKKSETEERCCAVLTLKGAGEWTPEGRRHIAEWLRQKARDLVKDGHNYSPRFRARYMAVRP